MLTANRAGRILAKFDRVKGHVQAVVQDHAPDERFADANDQLDRFGSLQCANGSRQDTKHTAFGAARHESGRWWLREQAAIAWPFLRIKHGQLALKAEDAAVHVGLAQKHAGVVNQITGREIVRPINNDIVVFEDFESIGAGQRNIVLVNHQIGIDVRELPGGTFELGFAHVAREVDDLTLQVCLVNDIIIHQPNASNSSGCQIQRQRAAQSTCTDQQDTGCLQFLLPLNADLRHNQMAAVTPDFVVRKLHLIRRDTFDYTHCCSFTTLAAATCDAWDNAEIVTGFERRLQTIAIANVFLADENIHEVA